MPTKVLQIDFACQVNPISISEYYDAYYILVCYENDPIGWVWIPNYTDNSCIAIETIMEAIRQQLGWNIIQQVLGKKLGMERNSDIELEGISVIVCTRNRSHYLAFCLDALTKLKYPKYEIIIVDNAPNNDDTLNLVANYPVHYVCEVRPGLNWARNRGIAEAKYNIVAFTDDDAQVDSCWLQAIKNAFINKDVMCVTGYVAPAELESKAQEVFEFRYGGMGHGLVSKVFDRKNLTDRHMMWASSFGVGANMAFRKDIFRNVGLFDIALDVGTPSRGAGDVDMFHQIVRSGYLLVYEPSMLIWHLHRETDKALKKQIFDNGCSFGCFIIKCMMQGQISRYSILKFLFIDWLYKWNFKNLIKAPKKLPRALSFVELIGMIRSPFAYRASKKWAKNVIEKHTSSAMINVDV